MIVPDFHHQRCYVKHPKDDGKGLSQEKHYEWNNEIDQTIYNNMDAIISCYNHTNASPTFHISSPIEGWNGVFKNHCTHADFIHEKDYPTELSHYSNHYQKDFRLDIEAKAKNYAIFKLENRELKIF
jgi:UV DNA damage repair endonuclease